MKRKTLLLTSMVSKLCEEIDNQTDLFFKERPFLGNQNLEPVITQMPGEKVDTKLKMYAILKEVKKLK